MNSGEKNEEVDINYEKLDVLKYINSFFMTEKLFLLHPKWEIMTSTDYFYYISKWIQSYPNPETLPIIPNF